MTTGYVDQYFDAADVTVFLELLAREPNVIGPRHGIPACTPAEGAVDENGHLLQPVPALGDPSRLYVGVRATTMLDVPVGASVTDPQLAAALLGVWA